MNEEKRKKCRELPTITATMETTQRPRKGKGTDFDKLMMQIRMQITFSNIANTQVFCVRCAMGLQLELACS